MKERKQLSSRWVFIFECRNILVGKENKISFIDRDDGSDGKGLTVCNRK